MKKFLNYFKVIFTIVIILALIYKIGIGSIIGTFKEINLIYLLPIFALQLLTLFFGIINFQILLRPLNAHIPKKKLTKYYFMSWAIGMFSPGKVGEFSIAYFLKKHISTTGEGFAVSLIDKFITFICLFLFALFGIFTYFDLFQSSIIIFFLLMACLSFLLFIYSTSIRNFLNRFIPQKISLHLKGFSRLLRLYIKEHKLLLFANFLVTLVKWAASFLCIYVIFMAFGQTVPFFMIVIITSVAKIISLVPVTISGLGIREGISVYLFSQHGISSSLVMSMSILAAVVIYLMAIIIIASIRKSDL